MSAASTSKEANAVEAKNLDLVFQTRDSPVHALSEINLEIRRGDFISFIGPSGCGKTTLLRVIADLEKPTGGSIVVNGVSPEQARLQRAYGYVFQSPALFPWRTVEGNLKLPLEIMGIDAAERTRRAKESLKMVNLEGFEKKFPWQLSGGMQQRDSIARALTFDPELLLMDEPFGALDALTRAHLQDSVMQIHAALGNTMIMITHDVDEAVLLSDRIVMMTNGPSAHIGEVLDVRLARPRKRLELVSDRTYIAAREAVLKFLYERHRFVEAA